jgi:hypothetical protein
VLTADSYQYYLKSTFVLPDVWVTMSTIVERTQMECIEDSSPVLHFLGVRCVVTEEKSAVVTFSALIQNYCICRAFL